MKDKRLLKLVGAFLNPEVLEDRLVSRTEEGTPPGGPLSPLLSNIMLVVSRPASVGGRGPKLKVNTAKNAVVRAWTRTFLGSSFTRGSISKGRVSPPTRWPACEGESGN